MPVLIRHRPAGMTPTQYDQMAPPLIEKLKQQPGEDILVAGEPEEFTRALVTLYESPELWNRLSQSAIEKTRRLYSVEVARERLERLFNNERGQTSDAIPESLQPRALAIGVNA